MQPDAALLAAGHLYAASQELTWRAREADRTNGLVQLPAAAAHELAAWVSAAMRSVPPDAAVRFAEALLRAGP